MPVQRAGFELFTLSEGIKSTPERLAPASFVALGALELQDIERWIRERPAIVGEELKIITNQFAKFDGSKDRCRQAPAISVRGLSRLREKRGRCDHADLLGIEWTRPNDRQIQIARRGSVTILDEFVGPKR